MMLAWEERSGKSKAYLTVLKYSLVYFACSVTLSAGMIAEI